MRTGIQTGYRLMDKGPLRALSLILALWLAGCLLWDPARYATRPEGILLWQGIVLIWAVCTGGYSRQRIPSAPFTLACVLCAIARLTGTLLGAESFLSLTTCHPSPQAREFTSASGQETSINDVRL